MYCPRCGSVLKEVPRPAPPEIDWDAPKKELDRQVALAEARDSDRSEDLDCKRCSMTFSHHHPIYGLKAAPGDSWSLSWVK